MAAIEPAVHLLKAPPPGCESVLSGDAIAFLTMLARRFEPTRQELLERRRQRQLEIDAGRLPDFLSETRDIRERDWTVAAIRPDGPVALADVARLGEEVGEPARVDLQLALTAPLEQLLARGLEAPRQHGEEGDRVAAQHALAPRRGGLEEVYGGLDRGHV